MKQAIKNFKFNDIVLYAKGWYQSPKGNVVEDLGYLFSKVYIWDNVFESDVAYFMLLVLDKVYEELNINNESERWWLVSHSSFELEVKRRMSVYEFSRDRAIISTVLAILQNMSKDDIILNPPHYGKKERFRLGKLFGAYPISQTYKEMNKIAKKTFSE